MTDVLNITCYILVIPVNLIRNSFGNIFKSFSVKELYLRHLASALWNYGGKVFIFIYEAVFIWKVLHSACHSVQWWNPWWVQVLSHSRWKPGEASVDKSSVSSFSGQNVLGICRRRPAHMEACDVTMLLGTADSESPHWAHSTLPGAGLCAQPQGWEAGDNLSKLLA